MLYVKMFGAERAGAKFVGNLLSKSIPKTELTVFTGQFNPVYYPPFDKSDVKNYIKYVNRPTQELMRNRSMLLADKIRIFPIIVTKNPYTWRQSIWRHRGLSEKDMDWDREYNIYNLLYKIYKDLLDNPHDKYDNLYVKGMSIKYEDVIDNPVEVLRKIVRNLNIAKAKTVALPQNSWFDAHGKSFYLSKGPWGLAPTKLRTVKNLVDWEVIGKYGYKPVKPEWFYDPVIYEEDDWTFKI